MRCRHKLTAEIAVYGQTVGAVENTSLSQKQHSHVSAELGRSEASRSECFLETELFGLHVVSKCTGSLLALSHARHVLPPNSLKPIVISLAVSVVRYYIADLRDMRHH